MRIVTSSLSSIAASAADRHCHHLCALITVLVLVLGLGIADAVADTLVVRTFRGPQAAKFQKSVVDDVLRDKNTVIPEARYTRAARKVKARGQSPRDIVKVCKELGASGVIAGRVQKRGARFLLKVTVIDCATGKELGSTEVRASRPPLIRAQTEELRGDLEPLLAKLGGAPGRGADEDRAVASKRDREDASSKAGKTGKQGRGEARADQSGEAASADKKDKGDEGQATRVAAITKSSERSAVPGIYVSAGLLGVSRNLTFDVRDGFTDPPLGFEGGLVPTVGIAAEVHPFVLAGKSGSLANLAITASFERVLKIESTLEYQPAGGGGLMEAVLPTSQSRLTLGVLYRHVLSSGISLFGALQYSRMAFEVDKGAAPAGVVVDIPNVVYQSLDPAIGGRYPINAKLGIGAEARVILMLDAGELQEETQYGVATALGFEGFAQVDYALLPRLALRAGVGLTRIGFSFEGTGAQTSNRDGDASTQDVLGATDQYLRLFLTAGYTF